MDRSSGGLVLPDEDHDEVGQLLTARRQAADSSAHNVTIEELVRRQRARSSDRPSADETVREATEDDAG
jgi:hypothetical protein